ncbi:MAG TPA: MoaD/ThiS family protein [Kiritimatiellia bacterium]|mgnify:CR=1 FL=1|nr:MoaD/ThiS family protein [Kiritimatiellia bacterium]
MKIRLEHVAMLKVQGPANGSELELMDGATVRDLLNQLAIPAIHQSSVTAFVNETKVRHDHVLVQGDHVFLSIPTSGG